MCAAAPPPGCGTGCPRRARRPHTARRHFCAHGWANSPPTTPSDHYACCPPAGNPLTGDDVLRARRTILPRGEFCCWAGASEVGNLAFNLFPPERDVEAGAIPVGSPASDKRVRIVDEHDADVPTGVTGEVVVESAHIASGYHANPELTARRFTSLPDGRTRYRTGDLGRLDENGELSLLGRDDDAVKVRGYLVEPLEVEAALLALPWTVDAVVTANRNEGRLTAHVAVDPAKWSPSPAEIRLELGKSLTPWMIPQDIIVLSELPRNERGKVVRAELPPPPPRPAPEPPPRGLTEFALHQVWCDILGLESIGRNEDFVELGGDSLAAAKMLAEVGHHLQLDVNTAMLAEAPTIARFAARIEAAAKERSKNASGATLIPLRKGTGDPIFLMAGAGSLATSLTPIVRALSGDRPVYGIQSRGGRREAGGAVQTIPSVLLHAARSPTSARCNRAAHTRSADTRWADSSPSRWLHASPKAGETCHTVAVLDSVIDPALAQRLSGERPNLIQRIRSSLRSLTAAKETLPDRTGSDEDSKPGGSPLQHALQQIALKVLVLTAGLVPLSTSVQWVVFFRLGTEMIRRHRPSPYSGPITVIRARTNTDDPALWGHFTSGRVEFVDVDGDHISVIRPPHVAATARAIDQVLERTSD